MSNVKFSVLMSVYIKEKPEYLKEALDSILRTQSVLTDDLVLVCDGPITTDLENVIQEYLDDYSDIFHVYRLEENQGLGNALNYGLKYCKNELVARMDTDDISLPNRFETQLQKFEENPTLTLLSSTIEEFEKDPLIITGMRRIPSGYNDIISFSKKRNPFNHPAVMFKKSAVLAVGGYTERFHLFEDYELWIRLLQNNYLASNIEEALVKMRTPTDLYLRRGGSSYAKDLLRFNYWMKKIGWISTVDYIVGSIPHAIVCILPNFLRSWVYQKLHSRY